MTNKDIINVCEILIEKIKKDDCQFFICNEVDSKTCKALVPKLTEFGRKNIKGFSQTFVGGAFHYNLTGNYTYKKFVKAYNNAKIKHLQLFIKSLKD